MKKKIKFFFIIIIIIIILDNGIFFFGFLDSFWRLQNENVVPYFYITAYSREIIN